MGAGEGGLVGKGVGNLVADIVLLRDIPPLPLDLLDEPLLLFPLPFPLLLLLLLLLLLDDPFPETS